MAVTMDMKYTLGFTDDTTQDITVGPFLQTAGRTAKDKIIEFNRNFNSDTAKLVLSRYGNPWTGIRKAQLITTSVSTYF